MVEPGSEVCWTDVSLNFDAVPLGVDSEFVGEGDLVSENFEDVGDGEKAFSGKELGKELLYNDQNLLSRIEWINCSLCRRQQLSGCQCYVRHIRCCHR
jgi:hypothetical protein